MTVERSFLLQETTVLDYDAFVHAIFGEGYRPPTSRVTLHGWHGVERVWAYHVGIVPETGRVVRAIANDPMNHEWRHLDVVEDVHALSGGQGVLSQTFPERVFFQYRKDPRMAIVRAFLELSPDTTATQPCSKTGWISFLRPGLGLVLLRPGVDSAVAAERLATCDLVLRASTVCAKGWETVLFNRRALEA